MGWKCVAFASRFCHPAEKNYSPVEGEALSAASGLTKFRHFVMGCPRLVLVVDHKPLVKLLGDRHLDEISNTRLLRLKEKTLPFRFRVVHRPGLMHKAPDYASRYPQNPPEQFLEENAMIEEFLEDLAMIEEVEICTHDQINVALEKADIQKVSWQMIKQATQADAQLSVVSEALEAGEAFVNNTVPIEIQPYLRYWHRLWVQDGVILLDDRTVIPQVLRERVLENLHSAHQGVSQMFARAEIAVFWPNLHSNLESVRAACTTCRVNAPSQAKLPPVDPPTADFPFQYICSDYMSLNGIHYLVTVDRLTGWPDVRRAANSMSGSSGLISLLREFFTTFGIAEELASDGGSEYMSYEVQSFLKKYGVRHRVSSVGNPHSNQRAEVGVKSMKRLLRGNTGPLGNLNNDEFARETHHNNLQDCRLPWHSSGDS